MLYGLNGFSSKFIRACEQLIRRKLMCRYVNIQFPFYYIKETQLNECRCEITKNNGDSYSETFFLTDERVLKELKEGGHVINKIFTW